MARQQLCPPFSRLLSPWGNFVFAPPGTSPALLSLLRRKGEVPTAARLTVAGKVGGRRQDAWKLLPVLHTLIPHPPANKTKDLYKTRLAL